MNLYEHIKKQNPDLHRRLINKLTAEDLIDLKDEAKRYAAECVQQEINKVPARLNDTPVTPYDGMR